MKTTTETKKTETTAQQAAREMGDDGTRFTAPDGRSLHQVCRAHGAEVYRDEQGERSYRFTDGSAIATSGGAWDVVHADCSCLWCWAGGELHCDEQQGEEYRCTLTDDEADEAEDAEGEPAEPCQAWRAYGASHGDCGPATESVRLVLPQNRDSYAAGARGDIYTTLPCCPECMRLLATDPDLAEERAAGWLVVE